MRRPIPAGETDETAAPVVGAAIAVFRPGPELVTGVEAVGGQVAAVVVVVDEHPVSGATREVVDACRAVGAEVVEHPANRGIGAALNTGSDRLRELRPDLTDVITLDQDSAVPDGYVAALLDAGSTARTARVRVGMVAPDSVGSIVRLPRIPSLRAAPDGVRLGGEPIQSGLLVPVDVLDRLHGFDEALFIDGVDTDFYLRARDLRLQCVVAPGTRLEHRLGQAVTTGDGRELPLLVASTFRYHYQWRNLVTLLRRHAGRHPGWAVLAVVRAVRHLAIVTVAAPGRVARLREAYAGLRAGLRGESGPR
ncbi:rhamnosyltransferase [Nocardioides exalbidus]|uniref:Rhamnosyltransferase n=1 Tax=Nocardioides exalbidus TaxID=402596 RepID=A0A1H4JGR9_9ACTN|nr:glycosyl transferase [Nocardioides exalbidus]SEB44868.1 rhamnosyltransferase [Nocardioides exalbidus]